MHAKRLSAASLIIGALLWALPPPASAVAFTARYGHTSTLMPDGNVVVIGGQTDDTPTLVSGVDAVQLSLEGQGTFVNGSNTNFVARASHTATLMPNGQILVAGGVGAGNAVLSSLQVYDPKNNCWTTATNSLTAARYHHTATLLKNGKVLLCGGQNSATPTLQAHFNATCDLYTPPTTPMSCGIAPTGSVASVTMLTQRAQHTATLLADGRVFMTGGRNFTAGNVQQYLLTSELYNPALAAPLGIVAAHSLIERRANHRATLMGNSKVLIAGGINDRNFQENRGYLSTVEIYDPVSDNIAPAASLPMRRSEHMQVLRDDGIVTTYGGLGNITTTFLTVNNVTIGDGSVLRLCGTTTDPNGTCAAELPTPPIGTANLTTSTIRNGASDVFFTIGVDLNPRLTGHINSGVIIFSSPTITLSNGFKAYLVPGGENAVNNPGSNTYVDLKGTPVTCDINGVCGKISTTIRANLIGQVVQAPQTVSISGPSGAFVLSAGSHITTNAPVPGTSNGDTVTLNPDGLTELYGTMRLSNLPKQYIGAQVRTGQATAISLIIDAPEATYAVSGGVATIPAGTVIFEDSNGTGALDFAFSLTGGAIGGSATAKSDLDPIFPDNAVVGRNMSGTIRLRMITDKINLTGGEVFDFDVATMVVRRMVFSDIVNYNPTNNAWTFDDKNGPRKFGQTATLTPAGTVRSFGGRMVDAVTGNLTLSDSNVSVISRLPNSWSPVSNMTFARGNHTTTLLPNGKFLIAGGTNGENVLPTADIFNPEDGSVTRIEGMTEPRDLHTATLMLNGTVLLAGGFTTNDISTGATDTADIFYPNSNTFRRTTSMPYAASNHQAIQLADGNILVTGGYRSGTYENRAAIYYSTAAVWRTVSSMNTARALHRMSLLQDGRVLVTGGVNSGGVIGTNEIFDPNHAPHWYPAEDFPVSTQLHSHAQVTLKDGRVLVVGGNDGFGETDSSFIYTAEPCANISGACGDGAWLDTTAGGGPHPGKRFSHTATVLPNGLVAVIGGATKLGSTTGLVERFDVGFSSYQLSTPMTRARAFHTTTVGPDGDIYAIGGFDGSAMVQGIEKIHFAGNPDATTPGVSARVRRSSVTVLDVSPFDRGNAVTITGTKLLGIGEASGGGAASGNSSFHNPGVTIQQVDGFMLDLTTRVYRSADPNLWSRVDGGSLTLTMPSNNPAGGTKPNLGGDFLPFGWYQLRTFTNTLYSDSFFAQAGPPKPAQPVGTIDATGVSDSQIQWTWGAATGSFDHYRIYSGTSGVFLGQVPASQTSFIQGGLEPNTTCVVFIAPSNISGDGPLSISGTHYSLAAVPASVQIASVSYNSVLLEWDGNHNNATNTIYEVSISEDDFQLDFSTPVPKVASLNTTSTPVAPLKPNTIYYFRVRAFNGDGVPTAFTASVFTKTRAPLDDLHGEPLSTTSIEWQWRDPGGVVNYKVYTSSDGKVVATPTLPKFLDTGLSTNTFRSIRVSAVTAAGEGPLSDGATTATFAATPALLASPLVNITTGSFTAQWGPNDNPLSTSYNLQILDLAGNIIKQETTTGFVGGLGNLKPAEPFTARVRALNVIGVFTNFIDLGVNTTNAQSPSELTVTNRTPDSVSLTWQTQNNHSSTTYEVSYTTDTDVTNTNEFKSIQTAVPFSLGFNGNTAVVSGLLTSSTYSFRVQGKTVLDVLTAFSNTVTTSPSNGGVARGSLGLNVRRFANSTIAGSIGPSPGRFTSVLVPMEGFPSDTFMTISTFPTTSLSNPCSGGTPIGLAVSVSPAMQPLKPIFLTFSYTDADLSGQDPKRLTLMRLDEGSGRCVPMKTTVDTSGRRIIAELNHLSQFQVAEVTPASTADATVVFPNPFFPSQGQGFVTFSSMPANARVRIFTMRGELVNDLTANAAGLLAWSGVNQAGRSVASGVYLAVVEGGGTKKIVKVVVLR